MVLFYDRDYVIIESGTSHIIYFGNINRAVKLNYLNLYYFKCILERLPGSEYGDDFIDDNKLDKARFVKFVSFFCDKKVLFRSSEELEENNFLLSYQKIVNERTFTKAYLHVTQKCNLRCEYCYNKHNLNRDERELSAQEWIKVIHELENIGMRYYNITGGEPLLSEDLQKIISCINGKKILLTNGTLLVEKKYKTLEMVDQIIVSLDSLDARQNDLNRGNSLKYQVLKNIEALPAELKHKLQVRSVLTGNNISGIHEMTEFLETEMGIPHIINECLPNSKDELKDFIPYVNNAGQEYRLQDLILCGAGVDTLAIDSNGDIYPCQSLLKEEFKIGSILTKGWETQVRQAISKHRISRGILDIPRCRECVYKYICGGGCKAITYNIYADADRINSFMCEHYKNRSVEKIRRLFVGRGHETEGYETGLC